jgi:hypothetical protein
MTARARESPGRQSLGLNYLRRLRNNPSTPHTYATNAEDLKDASRKHFDGAVTVHRQECLTALDRRARAGPERLTGMSFGAAQSGANEGCCTTDENARTDRAARVPEALCTA